MTSTQDTAGLSKPILVLGMVLWTIVGGAMWYLWHQRQQPQRPAEQASQAAGDRDQRPIPVPTDRPRPERLPEFVLTDSSGQQRSSTELLGQPLVVGFVFTRCASTCPMISIRMRRLQDEFPADQLRLLTITVDPRRDTPDVLQDYATQYGADLERWAFMTGEPEQIFRVVNEGFGQVAEELFGADRKPGYEVTHTNRVVLVAADGRIVDTFLATDDKDMRLLGKAIEKLNTEAAAEEATGSDVSAPPADSSEQNVPARDGAAPQPAAETPPAQDTPEENKPEENKPEENKPEENTSEENTPADSAEAGVGQAVDCGVDEPVQITVDPGDSGLTVEVLAPGQEPLNRSRPGLSAFALTSHTGQSLGLEDLLGRQWVASFMFTRCAGPCPKVMGQVKQLQTQLNRSRSVESVAWPLGMLSGSSPASVIAVAAELTDQIGLDRYPDFDGSRVRLVTFTVDPENDTVDVLNRYAGFVGAEPGQWYFLTGTKADVYRVITYGFGQFVREIFGEDRKPGFEVAHTTSMVHVDAAGRLRGQYEATRPVEMAALRRAVLTGRIEPDRDPVAQTFIGSVEVLEPMLAADESPAAETDVAATVEPPSARDVAPGTVAAARVAPDWVLRLPAVNAALNAMATVLLLVGYRLIRRGRREAHRNVMLTSFGVSVLFLVCYLTYHFALQHYTGESSRKFAGTGLVRGVYLSILLSHVVLAAAVPVLAVVTIWRGLKQQFDRHRRIARITFPVWLYVSVTGVIIYGMLYHWPTGG